MPRTSLLALALAISTSLVACRTAPVPAEPVDASQGALAEAKPLAKAPELGEISAAKHPMELLPSDTLLSFEVRAWARLLNELGAPELLAHAGQVGMVLQVMLDETGRALVENPERMREVGIDPEGSSGFAILDVRAESFVFWMTVSDRALFLVEFEKRSGERLDFGGTRAAEIASIGEDTRVILRDGFVFFVVTGRKERADRDLARSLADARPEDGLLASARYRAAAAGREGAVALFYMRPGELLVEFVEEELSERKRQASHMGELRWLIEDARERGASSAEMVELETELRAVSRDASNNTRDEAAIWQQIHAIFQPIESFSFSIGISEGELRADARARVPDSRAFLHRLFIELPAPSPMAQILPLPPMTLSELALAPHQGSKLIEAMMVADGEDPDVFDRKMLKEVGLSWRRDLIGLMNGQVGGGVYFRKPPSFRRSDRIEEQLDFVGYFGFSDRKAVIDALGRFASAAKVKSELKPKRIAGGWRFRISSELSFDVVVGSQHILFASEAKVAQNYQAGKSGGGMAGLRQPGLLRSFESSGYAGRALLDLILPFALEARRPGKRSIDDFDYRFRWHRDLEPDQLKKIRTGTALKKKRARLRGLYKRRNKKALDSRERGLRANLATARRLGYVSSDVNESSAGFEGSLVWRFEQKRLVSVMLDVADEIQMHDQRGASGLETLEYEIRKLESEIEEDRFREIDRWLEKHPQSPVVIIP